MDRLFILMWTVINIFFCIIFVTGYLVAVNKEIIQTCLIIVAISTTLNAFLAYREYRLTKRYGEINVFEGDLHAVMQSVLREHKLSKRIKPE